MATVVVGLLIALADPVLHRVEWIAHDLLIHVTASAGAGAPVADVHQVIVAIDDASIAQLGRWPWPPEWHARLIDRLNDAGASVIGLDVLLPPSRAGSDSGEAALVKAVARHGRVVMPVAKAHPGSSPTPESLAPAPALVAVAAGLGHSLIEPDGDGLVRRLHLDTRIGDRPWQAMPQVVAQVVEQVAAQGEARRARPGPPDAPPADHGADPTAVRGPIDRSPKAGAPWPYERQVLMPAGGSDIRQISAADLLREPADPQLSAALSGAVVWVGVTAHGLGPVIASPARSGLTMGSGVQWQAQVYEALQQGRLVRSVSESLCHLINLLPLALLAVFQQLRPLRFRAHGLWLLPLPTLGSAAALAFGQTWIATAGLSVGLAVGWLLTRSQELSGARLALQRERGRADATLHAIADSVITVDTRNNVHYLNPSAERLVGHRLADVRGHVVASLFRWHWLDAQEFDQALAECLHERRVVKIGRVLQLDTAQGERHVQIVASPIFESQVRAGMSGDRARPDLPPSRTADPVTGAVLAFSDVTQTQRANHRLQHEATHDTLTGLPNRALLSERLHLAVGAARASQRGLAVLFIDLDRFKRINDSLGHRQGDFVLQLMASRLQQCCNAHDTLSRWGGDEFVVLLEDVHNREAVASRAQRMIDSVTREFAIEQIEVACGCSIGIAMAPQDGIEVDALLAMADTAMYRGKAHGGKRFEFYASEMAAWTREWLTLETRLRHGLAEGAFVLHYQPQVDLKSGQLVGLEALLRWRQPDGELWMPARFLQVTEETGLILDIGEWVIREALGQLAQWREQGLPLVPVSVNVSTRQCLDRRLVQVVADALRSAGVAGALLKLEVTESTAMADLGQLRGLLSDLRELGVQVAMDDFGTGFSSLSHLKHFRIDQLKIDPSFVRDISRDANGAAIVRATIALAHGLGLPVVAEGVESQEQMQFLADHDCDIAQGYLYARAQDTQSIAELLRLSLATGTPMRDSLWRSTESMPNLAPATTAA